MKFFLCICLFAFTSLIARSQNTVNVDKDDYNAGNFFYSVSGEPVVTAKFVKLVEGTPFFTDEWLKSTIIVPQGKRFHNVRVKLDLMDGTLHYLDAKGVEFIAVTPIKEVILIDSVKNQNFRFVSSFSLRTLKEGWYSPLIEGNVSLFKIYHKILREDKPYGSAVAEQKIVTQERFVLIVNDQPFYLKNEKEVPSVLENKKAELEAFMKTQNKKRSLQERLIETITFYNSLVEKQS